MPRADSTIRVNIIGDAQSLTKATDKAEGAIGGMNKKLLAVGGVVAGAFAVENVIDFGKTALKEADRVGDAITRLEGQLGGLSKPLIDAADEFAFLGQSEGDMLDLQARVADIGTAAGLADDKLAPFAQSAAVLAAKMGLVTDTDAATWIEKIGKAATTGDTRSLRDLGINLSEAAINARALADSGKATVDALTDQDRAAAISMLVLEDLEERYGDVGEGVGDTEQKIGEFGAKLETLTGRIGEHLEGPLNDLLDFILKGIDGWEQLAGKLDDAGVAFEDVFDIIKNGLGPVGLAIEGLAKLIDTLQVAIDLWNAAPWNSGGTPTNRPGTTGGSNSGGAKNTTNVYVQGGSPEVIEQSVIRALQQAAGRGSLR